MQTEADDTAMGELGYSFEHAWKPRLSVNTMHASGDVVGQGVDVRVRYQLHQRVDLEVGYSHFFAGPFAQNTGPADGADFFYVQTTLRL